MEHEYRVRLARNGIGSMEDQFATLAMSRDLGASLKALQTAVCERVRTELGPDAEVALREHRLALPRELPTVAPAPPKPSPWDLRWALSTAHLLMVIAPGHFGEVDRAEADHLWTHVKALDNPLLTETLSYSGLAGLMTIDVNVKLQEASLAALGAVLRAHPDGAVTRRVFLDFLQGLAAGHRELGDADRAEFARVEALLDAPYRQA